MIESTPVDWKILAANGWLWSIDELHTISLTAMDHLTPEARSANMAKVKSKNTGPELLVRQALHAIGYRFRLHRKDLPGCPDIVLPRLGAVIFVHGCYWHRHEGCSRATTPETRRDFWTAKFDRTVERDRVQAESLRASGWTVMSIWECETRNRAELEPLLRDKLLTVEQDLTERRGE